MTDINISNYSSQEVREYVQKFDTNGDGKINDGKELQALLAGNNVPDGDTVNVSGRKKIKINDPHLIEQAAENYNSKSPEDRQKVVDDTNTAMTAKLETLEQAVDNASSATNTRSGLIGHMLGITYTKERYAKEFEEAANQTQDLINESINSMDRAFDHYIGNDVYQTRGFITDTDSIAKEAGYDSFDSFLDDYMQNFEKRDELESKFFDALGSTFSSTIDEAKTCLEEYKNGFENAKSVLAETVDDGITEDNAKELSKADYVTARTFEDKLIFQFFDDRATGVDTPKVEVNGQEYEVGKKYQEQGPNGKPRIVSYDRLGNKWDISHGGVKVND